MLWYGDSASGTRIVAELSSNKSPEFTSKLLQQYPKQDQRHDQDNNAGNGAGEGMGAGMRRPNTNTGKQGAKALDPTAVIPTKGLPKGYAAHPSKWSFFNW